MGDVSDTDIGAGDRAHWASLRQDATENIEQIDAPDKTVQSYADRVDETMDYDSDPAFDVDGRGGERGSVNSNSAAFAVADRSQQDANGGTRDDVNRGDFTIVLPGQAESRRVQFTACGVRTPCPN